MANINFDHCTFNVLGDQLIGCGIKQHPNFGEISSILNNLNPDLQELYSRMPPCDFGNITLINGDIMRFENCEHYEMTCDILREQYEKWTQLFLEKFQVEDEDEMDSIIDTLGFHHYIPLFIFEERYHFSHKSLRSVYDELEKQWLKDGAVDEPPFDDKIICHIEQTLRSKYHEICIGDTIYQTRDNGQYLIIPISQVPNLGKIRGVSTEVIAENADGLYSDIDVINGEEGCYYDYFYKRGYKVHSSDNNKKFFWSFKFQHAEFIHRYKISVVMINYKKNKRGYWRADLAYCALGAYADLYGYMINEKTCTHTYSPIISRYNAHKYATLVRVRYTRPVATTGNGEYDTIGPFTYEHKKETEQLHIDPAESFVECRHNGWTFTFNVETGNTQ